MTVYSWNKARGFSPLVGIKANKMEKRQKTKKIPKGVVTPPLSILMTDSLICESNRLSSLLLQPSVSWAQRRLISPLT
jgi:hypothetical protein